MKKLDLINCPLDGVNLIEASAGTGKTYSIANLYLRFILEKELPIQEILVVTFTEAATKELKERLRKNILEAQLFLDGASDKIDGVVIKIVEKAVVVLGSILVVKLLRRALLNIDEMAVFTIHGFCKRMLSENAFESKLTFDLELQGEAKELLEEIVNDYWRVTSYEGDADFAPISRDELMGLASRFTGNPDLKLTTNYDDFVDPLKLKACFKEIRQAAEVDSDEISKILKSKDNKLKRGASGYSEDNVAAWLAKIVAGEDVVVRLFSKKQLDSSITPAQQKKGVTALGHDFFDLCDEFVTQFTALNNNKYHEFVGFVREEFRLRKANLQIQTYDDLILNLNNALKSEPGDGYLKLIRQKFQVAMIDEFQDTDSIQNEIFQNIFSDSSTTLFMIGDPKQSIYGFRGADIFEYLETKKIVSPDKSYNLDTNYRSETKMVEAVNHFFIQEDQATSTINPFVYGELEGGEEGINYHQVAANDKSRKLIDPSKSALQIDYLDAKNVFTKNSAEQRILQYVTTEISRLLAHAKFEESGEMRPVVPGDIAILTASHAQAADLQKSLNQVNVPSVIQKSGNIYASDEAFELELFLAAILNQSPRQVNPFLTTRFVGLCSAELFPALSGATEENKLVEEWTAILLELKKCWEEKGFMTMYQQLLRQTGIRPRLLAQTGGERSLTNFLQLGEILHQATIKQALNQDALTEWFSEQCSGDLEESDETLMRLESDADRVKIMTLHKSKGLEFNIVFCPYFGLSKFTQGEKNPFIYKKEGNRFFELDATIGGAPREAWRTEQLAEQIRLLYVGLTRAVNRCYLPCGNFKGNNETALAYLVQAKENSDLEGFITNPSTFSFEQLGNSFTCEDLVSVDRLEQLDDPISYNPTIENEVDLKEPVQFTRALSKGWGIGSFSGLTRFASHGHRAAEVVMDHDELGEFSGHVEVDQKDDTYAFFDFPKGATVGSAVHEIFEDIDFTAPPQHFNRVIEHKLKRHALVWGKDDEARQEDLEEKRDVLFEMVNNVLATPIPQMDGFMLNQLPLSKRLVEMQFYYEVKKIAAGELAFIFKTHGVSISEQFAGQLGQLKFSLTNGFMTGFIDLIFEHESQFYVLDWKTNHLGHCFANYDEANLGVAMTDSYYILQYHLYVVALHLYLKQRLGEAYSYERQMGGVLYTFVRGMHPDHVGKGIFYDRPSVNLIEALTALFVEVK
ncbi:MAG: exodeoxyribonuclease V subunit beta [Lentisphaeria bacterium]|nr:exodeoxyribonuclease V subunit beta [Lentisphaeria bacterium]